MYPSRISCDTCPGVMISVQKTIMMTASGRTPTEKSNEIMEKKPKEDLWNFKVRPEEALESDSEEKKQM